MQLTPRASWACALALAALGAPRARAEEPAKAEPKHQAEDTSRKRATLETSVYSDSDHVTVFTPSVSGSIDNVTHGGSLRGTYLVDVVSAASVDIVSTASRRWTEVRQAGALEGTYKPHDVGVTVAGSFSAEPDYVSGGGGAQMMYDFDEKNYTLILGFGYTHDTIGRSGTPFSVFSRDVSRGALQGGLGWVVNRRTTTALAVDVQLESGDPSKPYRYVPMFAPDVAAKIPKGASIDLVNASRLPERPLEQLPLSRRRFALTDRWSYRFDWATLKLEERIYTDTWGLLASTTDAHFLFDLGKRVLLGPHLRLHGQGAASFWRRAYTSATGGAGAWSIPEYRTGDRELGPLVTFTGGGTLGLRLGPSSDPGAVRLKLQVDGMTTSFLDDLYVTDRSGAIGALILEVEP